jgi:hypothetical protein
MLPVVKIDLPSELSLLWELRIISGRSQVSQVDGCRGRQAGRQVRLIHTQHWARQGRTTTPTVREDDARGTCGGRNFPKRQAALWCSGLRALSSAAVLLHPLFCRSNGFASQAAVSLVVVPVKAAQGSSRQLERYVGFTALGWFNLLQFALWK